MRHRIGPLGLSIRFSLTEPWTILFGPSGSGKSTILRAIAGLLQPVEGEALMEDVELFSSARHTSLPAHQRPIRTAAQRERLFPHLTVLENLRYGSGWRSRPEEEASLLAEALRLFRLSPYAGSMPHALSGGERQRASVARAAVAAVTYGGPTRALLLLDEPFSGLDVWLRDALVLELQAWLRAWETPVLSVTHDVGEAFLLDAEIVRIGEGRVLAQGPAREVLAGEREAMLKKLI